MSFFGDDELEAGLDESFVIDGEDENENQDGDEEDIKYKVSFEEEVDEESDEEDLENEEIEMTVEEKRLYSSIPKGVPLVTNGKYSYIVVNKETLSAHPDILSVPVPILLEWVDSSITYPHLSRYEASALIEKRVEQFSQGEKSTISVGDEIDSFVIAERELKEKKLPLLVERTRKNGGKRIFYIDPNGNNSKGLPLFKGDYT